jgi:hypothetical protein
MTNFDAVNNGGVRQTTVKLTASGKPFGADIFVTVETTHEFTNLANDDQVLARQEELFAQLQAQVLDIVKTAASNTRDAVASTPRGQASIHPVAPAAPAPAYAGQAAPAGTGAPAVVAVANGATQAQGDWRSVPSRFGDGQIRFVSSAVYSSDQLKADVYAWIAKQGIDPNLFDVWDERTGPRGAEAGNPIGSVFNIKVKKDEQSRVPDDFHRNAAGRGKFNNDGSIYPYWSKDFEAFLKFGGMQQVSNAGF